nr:hypothetical protein [Nitritalea halalkaliphila]
MELNFGKNTYEGMWRLRENLRDGNLYATHGLGPIAQLMNINHGDQMAYLSSLSSADFHMGARAEALAAEDAFYAPLRAKPTAET